MPHQRKNENEASTTIEWNITLRKIEASGKKNNWEISELLFCLVTFPSSFSPWQSSLLEIGPMAIRQDPKEPALCMGCVLTLWNNLEETHWNLSSGTAGWRQGPLGEPSSPQRWPLCNTPLITRYPRQPAEKNSEALRLPAGKPWSPVVGNSSQPASQAGIFRFCLEDTETFIHFSFFVWSHWNPRHVIEMGYNCGLLHPPIWASWKEHGEPFLAKESQNGFLKIICWSRREKKYLLRRGGSPLGLIWEEAHLLFGNLVWALFCQLQNSSLEELKSHIWGWEIKRLGIIWVRSMAVINMRLCEE